MQTLSQLWPHFDRDGTGLSLANSDVLKQKKMNIVEKQVNEGIPEYYAKENVSKRSVFYLICNPIIDVSLINMDVTIELDNAI